MSTCTANAELLRHMQAMTTADVRATNHHDPKLAEASGTTAEHPDKLSPQGWVCLLSVLGIEQQLLRAVSHLWETWSEGMQGLRAGSGESLGCLCDKVKNLVGSAQHSIVQHGTAQHSMSTAAQHSKTLATQHYSTAL